MCGIAGVLRLDGGPPDVAELEAMSATLAHRGPDGDGLHVDGACGLAARRLALVDVAGGAQPVRGGATTAVLNGELYEHDRLREALRAQGRAFASRCDTEVLAHLVDARGAAAFADLRGMFAAATWDGQELLLARDPFGIKPLLWTARAGRLAFASELRALLALPWVARELDPAALGQFAACGAVYAPRTIVAGVHRLPAGHVLRARDGVVRVERFARPRPAAAPLDAGLDELGARARAALERSVALHLRADRPVGVLLSGGLDSGLVAALAARHGAPPAFTVGFDDPDFDELAPARALAGRLGLPHHEARITAADAARLLPEVARAMDEPRADATALPYWVLGRLAAGHVTAALSGEGADELFGGYQTYVAARLGAPAARAAALAGPLVRRVRASGGRLALDERLRRLGRGAGRPALERHHAFKALLADPSWLAPAAAGDPLLASRARWAETAGAGPLARLQDVDLGTFLADDLLLQADRAGMAHGLEVRVPFLDREVAGVALALPERARVAGLQTTKPVLRAAARGLLPAGVVRGEKRGFVAPAARWLRGPLRGFAREVLAPEVLRGHGVLRPQAVEALLDRHDARHEDLARPIWAALALTLWVDAHLRAPVTPARAGTLPAA